MELLEAGCGSAVLHAAIWSYSHVEAVPAPPMGMETHCLQAIKNNEEGPQCMGAGVMQILVDPWLLGMCTASACGWSQKLQAEASLTQPELPPRWVGVVRIRQPWI